MYICIFLLKKLCEVLQVFPSIYLNFIFKPHFTESLFPLSRLQAVYKCLLDRVPEEQKDTNVQWVA